MESPWPAMFTFLVVYTCAIISPGPNFILVTNMAMNRSRNEGLMTSLGVATGSGIFAFAGLVGLLPMVHSLPFFDSIVRFAGGGYLTWIGIGMLRNCHKQFNLTMNSPLGNTLSMLTPYRMGLLTNLTNPKAWAFYLSLFTLVMGPKYPLWGKAFLNVVMFLISWVWYSTVVFLFSSRTFQPIFLNFRFCIEGALGLSLTVIGIGVLLNY